MRTYLSTIVYRSAVKENLRRNKLEEGPPECAGSPDPTPFDLTVRREQEREIIRAIQLLTPSQRDILVLRFYGEFGYEEIAAMTGVALGTVKSRIFYAVKTVRTILQSRGVV
ncbi:MAG: RNA polymerase sigma factor [Ignavibacteriae bacterium]|nr:RNA polymerase sigma factor [Ignavibacteriota bacterium]